MRRTGIFTGISQGFCFSSGTFCSNTPKTCAVCKSKCHEKGVVGIFTEPYMPVKDEPSEHANGDVSLEEVVPVLNGKKIKKKNAVAE